MIFTQEMKDKIEEFYNKDRESDVQYCKFRDIPNSLKKEIYKIIANSI